VHPSASATPAAQLFHAGQSLRICCEVAGRRDASGPDPEGRLPALTLTGPEQRAAFAAKGITAQEMVAALGAHTVSGLSRMCMGRSPGRSTVYLLWCTWNWTVVFVVLFQSVTGVLCRHLSKGCLLIPCCNPCCSGAARCDRLGEKGLGSLLSLTTRTSSSSSRGHGRPTMTWGK
jgi:Peroxidase